MNVKSAAHKLLCMLLAAVPGIIIQITLPPLPSLVASTRRTMGVAALAQLETAAKLPSIDQRRSNTKSLNRKTKSSAINMLKLWKKMSRYIVNAYDADQVEPMREAAGSNFYKTASEGNFNGTFTMMGMVFTFLTANAETLAKDGKGMPDTFIGTFTAAKDAFDKNLSDYNAWLTTSEQGTSAKVTANAKVFKMMMDMMNDGKEIFEDDATVVKQFIYTALEKLERKNTKTGLHFIIREDGSKDPVGNSTLHFYPALLPAGCGSEIEQNRHCNGNPKRRHGKLYHHHAGIRNGGNDQFKSR